ncbi:MAG: SDR family oxidoreductase [Alphaproteobacteria bacterium]
MPRSLKQLMDLSGRVALITGGAGHVGGEAASALAELGADVAIVDIDGAKATVTAESIAKTHTVKSVGMTIDLADEAALKALPENVVKQFGRLDIIVNSAAFVGTSELEGWAVPFAEQSIETWRAALEVNLTAAFTLIQAAAPILEKSGSGSVINIASIYGMVGPDMRLYEATSMANPAAYGVSKGGLLQLSRWLSTALAPNIRVNSITPGGIWRGQPDSFVARYVERVPLGRMSREEDMKGAIAYLASDLSSYVTGENIVVDGGWTAW